MRLSLQVGEVLAPQPKAPPLVLCPAGPRIVRAEVEQEWIGRVAVGQEVTFQDDATSDGPTWTGKVIAVADWMAPRRIEVTQGTVEGSLPADSKEPLGNLHTTLFLNSVRQDGGERDSATGDGASAPLPGIPLPQQSSFSRLTPLPGHSYLAEHDAAVGNHAALTPGMDDQRVDIQLGDFRVVADHG